MNENNQNNLYPENELVPNKGKYRPLLQDDEELTNQTQSKQPVNNFNIDEHDDNDIPYIHTIEQHPQQGDKPNTYFNVETVLPVVDVVVEKPKIEVKKELRFTKEKILQFLKKRLWIVAIAGVVLVGLLVTLVVFLLKKPVLSSTYDKVTSTIKSPSILPSGTPGDFSVDVQNNENITVRDIKISLTFDKQFTFSKSYGQYQTDQDGKEYKVDFLTPGAKVSIQFKGSVAGNIDDTVNINGTFSFVPDTAENSQKLALQKDIAASKTKIQSPEIRVDIVPRDASVQTGNVTEFTVEFENLSNQDFQNVRLKMTYPTAANFTYQKSVLSLPSAQFDSATNPQGRDYWDIPLLPRSKKQVLTVTGKVYGQEGTKLNFTAEVLVKDNDDKYNSFAESSKDIVVTSQAITVKTGFENKDSIKLFDPGETVNVYVDYENTSSVDQKNLIAAVQFVDPANVIDYSNVRFSQGQGNVNVAGKQIDFKGSGVPEFISLAPQAKSTVRFSIKIKDVTAFTKGSFSPESYYIQPKVIFSSSLLQPIEGIGNQIKARGKVNFIQGLDQNVDSTKTQTTYHITWTLKTNQTSVSNLKVQTTTNLPASSWSQLSVAPSDQNKNISYDPNSGKIVWNVGNIKANSGITNPVITVSFDLVTNTLEGGGREIYSIPVITGLDDYTGENYNLTGQQTNSR